MPTALAAPASSMSRVSSSVAERPRLGPAVPPPGQRLAVKVGRQTVYIAFADLRWVQAARNYLRLYTGADYHLLRETMSNLEAELDSRKFVRIHRCTLVNRDCVREVRHLDNGQSQVILDDGAVLRMSRGYRHVLNQFARLASPALTGLSWKSA
jgi:two-component system LytT family response regulator